MITKQNHSGDGDNIAGDKIIHYHITKETTKSLSSNLVTNRPYYIDKQYNNDIFRKKVFDNLLLTLSSENEPNSLCIIYGPPGIGKSSFMATSFSKLDNKNFNKIIYFIEDNIDDLEHIEQIYQLIENTFLKKFQEKNIDFDSTIIYGDNSINVKLEYIFNIYSKEIYIKENKPFILMFDGLDILADSDKFVLNLVKNYLGIHFIFSSRKNLSKQIYLKIKEKNKDLYIYTNRDTKGISLENLNRNDTSLYFEKIQKLDKLFNEDELNNIKDKVYQKSKGLPKYFELLINILNKLAIEYDNDIYEKVNEYINKLPIDLEEFYINEFSNIKQNSKLSLDILIILYWNSKAIEKSMILNFIKENDIDAIDKALEYISYFLNKDKGGYKINHLSIKEALFVFFEKNEFHELTAIRLEESFIKKTFQKETPILKYLADNSNKIYELFSSIYYFDEENVLFQGLKSIVEIAIRDRFIQKDLNMLSIYFDFARMCFARDMISSEILSSKELKVTSLFQENYLSDNTEKFILNVLILYIHSDILNIHNLKLLLSMSILGQNNYFISKYLNKYQIFTYNKKYSNIFADSILMKKKYKSFNSISSNIYVSMYSKVIEQPLDVDLDLYEDSGLILLYDKTISANTYQNIIDVLIKNQRENRQRGFYEKQVRIYQTIKHSSNIGLKKYFYRNIYIYAKKKNILNNRIKKLLNKIAYDILIQDIKNLSFSNKMYKYLFKNEKNKLNKLYQFYQSYKKNSLSILLKNKNLDFFKEIITFIEVEDILKFVVFYIDNSDEKTTDLINIAIRKETTKDILIFCKNYLLKKGIISHDLLVIYYKLGDIEKLTKTIINIELSRDERSLLNRVLNSIDKNFLDIYPLVKKTNLVTSEFLENYLKKSEFSIKEANIFLEVISKKHPEKFSKYLLSLLIMIKNNSQLKQIFLKYKKNLTHNDMNLILLNIIRLDDFDKFVKKFNYLDNNTQIEFLSSIVQFYIQNKSKVPNSFFYLLFKTISKSNFDVKVRTLLLVIYKRKDYIDFCIKNYEFIEEIYLSVDENLSKDALYSKALLYKLAINHYAENRYFELLEQNWIPVEIKSKIAMVLIVKMNSKEEIKKLSFYCKDFDLVKVLIHIGIKFDSQDELKRGIYLLYKFRNEKVQNRKYFENYLEFTLINNNSINQNSSNFIKNIFIPKYKNKTLLSTFLNIEKFIATNEFKEFYIQFPKEFLKNYLMYIKFENKVDDSYFNDISDVTLKNMAILYEQYKEAEKEEDEEKYYIYEAIFSRLKRDYFDILNKYFTNIETLTLDNMFLRINYTNNYSAKLIKSNYNQFYKYIQSLYQDFISKEYQKRNNALNEFNKLKEEITSNIEYLDILKEKTLISSKLSLKLENIELFKPLSEI